MDLVLNIPMENLKKTLEMIRTAKQNNSRIFFKLDEFPTNISKINKIFIVIEKMIYGWCTMSSFTTSNKEWEDVEIHRIFDEGHYFICASNSFVMLDQQLPYDSNSNKQIEEFKIECVLSENAKDILKYNKFNFR